MPTRPEPTEYDPVFATYIDKVPEGDILSILTENAERTLALLASCPEAREQHAYAPGKWSIRELVGHVIDAERLFAYRALHFARGDTTPLPGTNSSAWAQRANAAERPLRALAAELASVRGSTVNLFASFDAPTLEATGVAGGRRFSVRSLAYMIAGHEIHHRGVLEDLYLEKR